MRLFFAKIRERWLDAHCLSVLQTPAHSAKTKREKKNEKNKPFFTHPLFVHTDACERSLDALRRDSADSRLFAAKLGAQQLSFVGTGERLSDATQPKRLERNSASGCLLGGGGRGVQHLGANRSFPAATPPSPPSPSDFTFPKVFPIPFLSPLLRVSSYADHLRPFRAALRGDASLSPNQAATHLSQSTQRYSPSQQRAVERRSLPGRVAGAETDEALNDGLSYPSLPKTSSPILSSC
ncbi:hypothetical protein MRX96_047857 [Rhipicephalus microplus]